jgi:hypothetical protein
MRPGALARGRWIATAACVVAALALGSPLLLNYVRMSESETTRGFTGATGCALPKLEAKAESATTSIARSQEITAAVQNTSGSACVVKVSIEAANFEIVPAPEHSVQLGAQERKLATWIVAPKREGVWLIRIVAGQAEERLRIDVRTILGLRPEVAGWLAPALLFVSGGLNLPWLLAHLRDRRRERREESAAKRKAWRR